MSGCIDEDILTTIFGAQTAAAAPAGEPYALGTPPETLQIRWPEPPRITREVESPTSRPRRQRRLCPVRGSGSPETSRGGASDVEIVFAAGTGTDVLFLGKGLSRIAVRGGEVEHFEIELPATFWPAEEWREEWMTTDVLVDGMVASAGDTAFLIRAAKRIAVLRSRCTAGRYSVWVGDSGGFESEDVILAGNDFESAGPEATVRLVHVERSAVVENRITNRGGVKHNYRIHGRSRLNWASRNDLVHSGIMLGTMDGDSIREQYFDDNVLWHTTPSLIEIHLDTPAVTMRGNTVHSDVWSCFLCRGTPAGWVIEDNTILPYEPPPVR